MRILIKGGVWKNTEDEILKAAVMKYGKNGWARVASLLNRKSAKQCKARWYEWLDPSIKKTEWNRDEEEKLLHLAKLMPNQWRTIAPIVGRTATQCMEHYERLLDQAQEQIGEAAEDARRLRPGEIDPAPETKPARPDPIDMDEDEKEMLSEARARLANTQGKKAKRKARERTMAESRRLSMLQKRRELKAAGIESKLGGGHKKRKYIDFAREIPFQAVPPSGFYDVREENLIGKKDKLDPTVHGLELSKMEGRHQREEEEKAKQKDQRALKKLFKENAPLAISQISAENDPVSLRRRLPLSLPTPQVSDGELEEIVKLGQQNASLMAPPIGLPSTYNSNQSTQVLIGDYSNQVSKSLPTPLRTPLQEDIIMQEAKNLRALREMTPLFGTEQEFPELYEGTGYAGIEPRRAHLPTPNTFLNQTTDNTPLRNDNNQKLLPSNASITTASVRGSGGSSSIAPVLRDQFGLNSSSNNNSMMDDTYSESGMTSIASVRQDKLKEKIIRNQISSQLKGLPEPEYSYEVAAPQLADDDDQLQYEDSSAISKGTAAKIEDAAEVRAKQLHLIHQKELEELAKRSTVLKRSLPRPTNIPNILAESSLDPTKYSKELVDASRIINEEMVQLLRHDEFKYPITKNIKKNQPSDIHSIELVDIPNSDLMKAKDLLDKEMNDIFKPLENQEYYDQFNEIWLDMHKDLMFIPNSTNISTTSNMNNTNIIGEYRIPKNKQETLHALMNEFTGLKTYYDRHAKRANKIESKLQITTLGYMNRGNTLQQNMIEAYDNYTKLCIEEVCYISLYEQESRVINTRMKKLKQELQEVEDIEKNSQAKYARIMDLVKEYNNIIPL